MKPIPFNCICVKVAKQQRELTALADMQDHLPQLCRAVLPKHRYDFTAEVMLFHFALLYWELGNVCVPAPQTADVHSFSTFNTETATPINWDIFQAYNYSN